MTAICRHCRQAIEPDPENEWIHSVDGVVGCGLPFHDTEVYAEPENPRLSSRFNVTNVRWYPVVNDLIGGWAVSHVDKPLSEQNTQNGEGEVTDFCTEQIARHIADLHNAWVDRQ